MLAWLPMVGSTERGRQDAKAAVAAQDAASSPVVIRVLGESITEKQVLVVINEIVRSQQATPEQAQKKNTIFFKDALDTLIGGVLLKNQANEQKIVPDPVKINETYQSVRGQFASEEAFQKALQGQGLKEADLRRSVENNVLYQQVLDLALKGLPIAAEAEIQKFYGENPKYFEEPEQVHASHIFVKVDRNATPEQKADARKRLDGIRADLESKKITFQEAAAKYSDDAQTKQTGGDLGFFGRGRMLPPLETAAFTAKPGVLTPIVETEFGLHIIAVMELKPAGKAPLDKVRPDIKNYLERKTRQDATKKYIEDLKAKVKIETVMSEEEWNKRNTGKQIPSTE